MAFLVAQLQEAAPLPCLMLPQLRQQLEIQPQSPSLRLMPRGRSLHWQPQPLPLEFSFQTQLHQTWLLRQLLVLGLRQLGQTINMPFPQQQMSERLAQPLRLEVTLPETTPTQRLLL
jgi:hypothetical protein